MNVLLDTCVSGKAVDALRAAGHDVTWAGDWDRDPGDAEILRLAHEQQRVLVTLDKDFGELAVGFGHPHWGSFDSSSSAQPSKVSQQSSFSIATDRICWLVPSSPRSLGA